MLKRKNSRATIDLVVVLHVESLGEVFAEVLVATVEEAVVGVGGAVGVLEAACLDSGQVDQATTIIPGTTAITNGLLPVICSKYPAVAD